MSKRKPVGLQRGADDGDGIAESDHDRAMRAWRDTKPRTDIVNVEYSRNWNSTPTGAAMACPKTPAEMRQAADELRALANWFEAKPEETK